MSAEEPLIEEGGAIPDFLRDPVGIFQRRWPWSLLVATLGVIATFVVVSQLEPRYEASATIKVTSQRIPEHFVRSTVDEDSIAQINSMMGQVLTRENLAALAERHGLYADRRDTETVDTLVAQIRADITVEPEQAITRAARNSATRLLLVRFEAHDPEVAAAVANEIASLFTAENIRSRSRQARLTTEFLRRELKSTEEELRIQEARITEFKETWRGELPGELDANLGRLERLQSQRQSLTEQIEESTTRLTLLSQGTTETPNERLLSLQAKLNEELSVHTERHPDVVNLRRQIELVEAQIASEAAASPNRAPQGSPLAMAEQRHLDGLRAQLRQTGLEIDRLDERVARTPRRQEELTALERNAKVLRDNYLDFLRKVQEAELAQSLEAAQYGTRFTVLDRAIPPTRPTTSPIQFLAAGIVLSLGLAAGLALLLEMLDPVLVASDQIERISELPVLGSVPHIG